MTRKGQVTVPADIRREMNVAVGDRLAFVVQDGEVKLERPGSWAERTYGIFKQSGARVLTERELKNLAEQAIVDEAIESDERIKRGLRSRR